MTKLRLSKSKEIDRRELEKHRKQDAKSEQNPKGGFRLKLINRKKHEEYLCGYYNY